MKKVIQITNFILMTISAQIFAQSIVKNDSIEILTPNDFPELIFTNIPGAPKLGSPQLIMGDTIPVRGEGMGWAAPAVYDWNDDGKKDLLIGEFMSGLENKGLSVGNFIRVYQNKGTNAIPKFYDDFSYAHEVIDLKISTGTPLSIYTYCCLAFTPRFVDLDSDGFTDLLTGQYMPGYITWFKGSEDGFLSGKKLEELYDPIRDKVDGAEYNSRGITDPTGFNYWVYSSVDFGDFDNDGDQDMVIGGGPLRICENIGTKSNPKFGKRVLLFDNQDEYQQSGSKGLAMPYVVDWNQDGILDILLTHNYTKEGSIAVTFFQGIKAKEGQKLEFEKGIPLFLKKDGGKAFPGSWLNVCVADWNNDNINDLLIGTSIATLNGKFNYELSWSWEHKTGIYKKNPGLYSNSMKRIIEKGIKSAERYQEQLGITDEELEKKSYPSKTSILKHYYGEGGLKNETLAHQGYVYVMLGEKRNQ